MVLDWYLNFLGWIDVELFELVLFNFSLGYFFIVYLSFFFEELFIVDLNIGYVS